MIYLLKFLIRIALYIFCKEINTKSDLLLNKRGPLLIIANHPNSFLDAIIIAAQYHRRIFFLARGDVFTKKHHRFLLRCLNMIPVYRLREGRAFLHLNEYAFVASKNLLAKGEAVLIFIEGTCLNTNELQPFKKGTTRILQGAQQLGVCPTIHLAGIAYNHFRGLGKRVNIVITEYTNVKTINSAKDRVYFNKEVFERLNNNIIPPTTIPIKTNNLRRVLFAIGRLAFYFQAPYYFPLRRYIQQATNNTVFYDSVLFAALLFTYPLFLIFLFFILYQLSIPGPIILIILVTPPLISKSAME